MPPYTYAATAGKGAPVIVQALLYWERDTVKGAFLGPSFPSQAVGHCELGPAWAVMLTSARALAHQDSQGPGSW